MAMVRLFNGTWMEEGAYNAASYRPKLYRGRVKDLKRRHNDVARCPWCDTPLAHRSPASLKTKKCCSNKCRQALYRQRKRRALRKKNKLEGWGGKTLSQLVTEGRKKKKGA
jgi:hypothetical protein